MKIHGVSFDKLVIGGYTWTIEECHLSEESDGCTDKDRFVIQIQKGMTDEHAFATLIHEMLHAIFFLTGEQFDEQEEKIIKNIEYTLARAIYDNLFCKKKNGK